MIRRRLGSLEVSVVGVGCNQFGPTTDERETSRIVRQALDEGINFFDTADEYGPEGISEEYLGKALRGRRDEAVIATKFGHLMGGNPERGGASRRWIVQAVEDSLRRLRTDRIDLYQQHFPDPRIDPEETMEALDRLERDGKILHHGICNVVSTEIEERCAIARSSSISAPIAFQGRYNLLRREARGEVIPVLEKHGIPLIPYFPLAGGMLTGKYRSSRPLPDDSRFAHHLDPARAQHIIERDGPAVERLESWANARGGLVSELAIAWLVSQPIVGSVIAGVTKPEQVAANVRAAQWSLSKHEIEEVAALVDGSSDS